MTDPRPLQVEVTDYEARRAGVLRARAQLSDVRTDAYRQPFAMAKSGPPRLIDQRTLVLMGVQAQAHADARRLARMAPDLFIPQVQHGG